MRSRFVGSGSIQQIFISIALSCFDERTVANLGLKATSPLPLFSKVQSRIVVSFILEISSSLATWLSKVDKYLSVSIRIPYSLNPEKLHFVAVNCASSCI